MAPIIDIHNKQLAFQYSVKVERKLIFEVEAVKSIRIKNMIKSRKRKQLRHFLRQKKDYFACKQRNQLKV